MQVMFDHMPDDPLTCEGVFLVLPCAFEDVFQVGRRPARESSLDKLEAFLQTTDQFCGIALWLALTIP